MRFYDSPLGEVTQKLTESAFTEQQLQLGLAFGIIAPLTLALTPTALATANATGLRLLSSSSRSISASALSKARPECPAPWEPSEWE